MAKLQYRTLSSRPVDALKVEKDTVFWDRELTGFGARAYPSGGKVYVVQARGPKGPKRVTVGRHGVINADQARRRAALIIARIKAGEVPVAKPMALTVASGPTVAELAARYMEEHVAVRCKPMTEKTFRSLLNKHVLPAFGKLPLAAVGREQVTDLHHRLHGTPTTANMVISMLSHMLTMAEDWGLAPEGTNPCKWVVKYPERKRERFLTSAEFDRLGRVLDEASSKGGATAPAVAALRLLMLTGCRKGEILTTALGGCGTRCERDELAGRQDRLACGFTVAGGGSASCRLAAHAGESLGHPRSEARDAFEQAGRRMAVHQDTRRGSRTSVFTICGTRLPAAL